jgi:hypothetical protein
MMPKQKKTFVICSVRGQTPEQLAETKKKYIEPLEKAGYDVHWPPRDTNQVDPLGGYGICSENVAAIATSDDVHIVYSPNSEGSKFDIGATFALKKKLFILNIEDVAANLNPNLEKSFEHVLLEWDKSGPPTTF